MLPQGHGEESIEVLVDGDAYFPSLIESVLEATDSVKMRTYIFDSDDYATALADMLKRRSAEVDVQVMFDSLGTLMAQDASASASWSAPKKSARASVSTASSPGSPLPCVSR